MRLARLGLIVTLAANLVAAGFVPAEHFHHATATRQATIHAHLAAAKASPHATHAGACCVEDEDHDAAVDLARVMAAGPDGPSSGQLAVLAHPTALSAPPLATESVAPWTPDDAPSPPTQPTAPRAPPA